MALGSHRGFYLCTFYVDFEIIGGVMNKKIVWWTIEIEWEDGTRETLNEIPNWAAGNIDDLLTQIEDERNEEQGEE